MTKKSSIRTIFLRVLAVLILAPGTFAGAIWTLVVGARTYERFFKQDSTVDIDSGTYLVAGIFTILGWFGIVTGWKLYEHFLRSSTLPEWHVRAWSGLFCGSLACLALVHTTAGDLPSRLIALGWPLLGSLGLGGLLLTAKKAGD
ncbi:hypothetical protein [Pseudomonas sp. COW5]|uniref:hypothetical protein n=1 Tax=Pseudomonas sp. COW5 TaxID=2981253 RepID=UPI0022462BA3|nr:hypothetical protein [Pseudomonas sp. COW5]MCX2546747.1 hypothetical protein [Pseudomonas sp. COW5]